MTTPTLGEMKNDELQTILGDLVGCHRDYCSDANAVAEVRKGLTQEQKITFLNTLRDQLHKDKKRCCVRSFIEIIREGFAYYEKAGANRIKLAKNGTCPDSEKRNGGSL
jgi:hypothetical protein